MVGELNSTETICFCTIKNKINSFLITINDPFDNNNYLDITIFPKYNFKAKVNIINGSPFIEANCKFEGKITSMKSNSNYLSNEKLTIISESANSYLKSIFNDYLYKTSKDFNSDINGFGKFCLNNYETMKDQLDFKWLSNYKNSTFKINFKTKIQSGMLLTKT